MQLRQSDKLSEHFQLILSHVRALFMLKNLNHLMTLISRIEQKVKWAKILCHAWIQEQMNWDLHRLRTLRFCKNCFLLTLLLFILPNISHFSL